MSTAAKTVICLLLFFMSGWSIHPAHLIACQAQGNELGFDAGKVFDKVTETVQKNFYNPDFDFESWMKLASEKRPAALAAADRDEFAIVVNELLAELKTSHTYYFSKHDPKRYQLFGIFHRVFPDASPEELCVYQGIGLETQMIENRRMVTAVYEGLPADQAGIRYADEILSVDGKPFHPFLAFQNKAGRSVTLEIKRADKTVKLPVQIEKLDGRTMFERTLEASIRTINYSGKKIGYIHLRSYAGQNYQEALKTAILFGPLSQCDGLVLDIRDGWGGANLNYLNLFRPPIANVESTSRTGVKGSYSGVWGKPVTLLTNGRSTSGKELLSYGFRKLKLGTIVGENTAGAVVAGRSFLMPNGDALYLAVLDVRVDGIRLEGRGVAPDVVVPRPLQPENAASDKKMLLDDPQIKAAVRECFQEIARKQ